MFIERLGNEKFLMFAFCHTQGGVSLSASILGGHSTN